MEEGLYINNIPEHSKIVLSGFHAGLGTVTGYITSEISISASANWSPPQGMGAQQAISDAVQSGTKMMNMVAGTNVQSFRLESVKDSVLNWQGSENFPLNLPMTFVATSPDDDVRSKVRTLLAAQAATFDPSAPFSSTLKSPNGYQAGNLKNQPGAITVRIGKWFRCPRKLFVVTSADFSFSKEVISSGLPLYASGSVSLLSYRLLSRDDILSMLGG